MTDPTPLPGWGDAARLYHCHRCDWAFVALAAERHCPHCAGDLLRPLDTPPAQLPAARPPEAVAAFTLAPAQIDAALRGFVRSIPLAPADLTVARLRSRLQPCYLPRWLVDASVAARWQAEAGFDYEIVSHEEQFEGERKQWRSQQVRETRIRWEPRLGQLQRRYENAAAPALEEDALTRRQLGEFAVDAALPYRPAHLAQAVAALPNRSPEDAWNDARPHFEQRAQAECQQAAAAQHLRAFRWAPRFSNLHWTQLLLPVYATHYQDEKGQYRPILIHGQSGQVHGERRASLARATRIALIVGVLAAAALLAGLALILSSHFLGVNLPPVLGAGALLLGAALAIAALAPPIVVWVFNRGQNRAGPGLFAR